MTAKLKPCPFCGRKVYIIYSSATKRFSFIHMGMRYCAFDAFYIDTPTAGSMKEAAELWNRRVEVEQN